MSEKMPKEIWIERKHGVPDKVWVDTTHLRGKNKTSQIRQYIRSDEHLARVGRHIMPLEDRIKKLESQVADFERVLKAATGSHDVRIAELAAHTLGRLL